MGTGQSDRRWQGAANKARGAAFEHLVESACDYYRAQGAADIEKTPEPMQPIKDLGSGRFIAHYAKAAQVDFKGFLKGGRAVCFEAKHTDTGKMEQDRVAPHQAERLNRATCYGALAFVLCSFGAAGYYRVPWETWLCMKSEFGHKYITPQEVAPFKVRLGGNGVLLFLEGMD